MTIFPFIEEALTASVAAVAYPSVKEPVGVAFATITIGIQAISQQKFSNVMRDLSVTQDGMSAGNFSPTRNQVIVREVLKASVAQ